MPMDTSIKKVLVIGSGPIVIGQAAEFDYAGAQACRVLKEAGVEVVLVQLQPCHHHDRSGHGGSRSIMEPLTTGDHQAHHQKGAARQPSCRPWAARPA